MTKKVLYASFLVFFIVLNQATFAGQNTQQKTDDCQSLPLIWVCSAHQHSFIPIHGPLCAHA